jgi:hypothetical protein
MKWDKIKKYFIIIGIALFIYLLIKLDVRKIIGEVREINIYYLLIAVSLFLIYLIFQTLKWFVIARKQKVEIPFREAFKINVIANFYGFVTPARIGSITRATYFKDYKGGSGKGLGNFIIDKILDISSLLLLAIGFGFLLYKNIKIISTSYLYVFIGIFLLIILFSLIFYKKKSSKFFLKFLYHLIPERLKNKARLSFESFYENMPPFGFLILVFILNLVTWVIDYMTMYFIALSLGVDIHPIFFLVILPISTLVAQIPITINGLGTRELTLISLFGLFGVEAVKVFAMSVISLVISGIIPAVIAIFLILFKKDHQRR